MQTNSDIPLHDAVWPPGSWVPGRLDQDSTPKLTSTLENMLENIDAAQDTQDRTAAQSTTTPRLPDDLGHTSHQHGTAISSDSLPTSQRGISRSPAGKETEEYYSVDEDGEDDRKASQPGQPAREQLPRAGARPHPSNAKRLFGLKKPFHSRSAAREFGFIPGDYEQRYPPDEPHKELGPNARVWHVYLDEAEAFDDAMVEGWKDTIDVLLVFAGLFSAVVTTFVVQTSQALQPDYGQITASLLTEMVSLQRATALGQSVDSVQQSALNASSLFTAATMDRWVNGLWFTSLSLSLATALFSVLVKQWLQHYVFAVSGIAQEQAHVRQFRFRGLERWHVRGIIGWLPVLMHLSLLVFFAGLVVFLRPLDATISWIMAGIACFAYLAYFVANTLPMLYPGCPYKTPLTHHMNLFYHTGLNLISYLFKRLWNALHWITVSKDLGESWLGIYPIDLQRHGHETSTLRHKELGLIHDLKFEIDIESLIWLFNTSSNPTVIKIVCEAISALEDSHKPDLLLEKPQFLQRIAQDLNSSAYIEAMDDDNRWHSVEKLVTAYIKLHLQSKRSVDEYQEIEWQTWDIMIEIAKQKKLYRFLLLGYCGLMLSSNGNVSKLRCFSIMADGIEDLFHWYMVHAWKNHIFESGSSWELFALCLKRLLKDNAGFHLQPDWKFTIAIYNIVRIDFMSYVDFTKENGSTIMMQCLCIMLYKCHLVSYRVAGHLPVTNNNLVAFGLLSSDYDLENMAITYKILSMDVICNLISCYQDWQNFENQNTMHLLIKDLKQMFDFISVQNANEKLLINLVFRETYLQLGKFLKSRLHPHNPHNMHIEGKLAALHLFDDFQGNSISLKQDRAQIWDAEVFDNLYKCLAKCCHSKDQLSGLVSEVLLHLNRCLEINLNLCQNFITYNRIEILQEIRSQSNLTSDKFDAECYKVVEYIFSYTFCMIDMKELTGNSLNTECLEYILIPKNIVWCYSLIGKFWSPKEQILSHFKKFKLIEMYTLSLHRSSKDIWQQILKDLILMTRNVSVFNKTVQKFYLPDFDILEGMKHFLGIDATDEDFVLCEYDVKYTIEIGLSRYSQGSLQAPEILKQTPYIPQGSTDIKKHYHNKN